MRIQPEILNATTDGATLTLHAEREIESVFRRSVDLVFAALGAASSAAKLSAVFHSSRKPKSAFSLHCRFLRMLELILSVYGATSRTGAPLASAPDYRRGILQFEFTAARIFSQTAATPSHTLSSFCYRFHGGTYEQTLFTTRQQTR